MKKKLLSLLLASALVLSACGTNNTAKKEEPAKEETGKKEEAGKTTEAGKEEAGKTAEAGKEAAQAGEIAKIGVGHTIKLSKSKAVEDGKGTAQADVTVAAAAFDKDGKVVKVQFDVAQNKVGVKEDGTFVDDIEKMTFLSKKQLGADYGMKAKSGIGKEWFEQAQALEEYFVGKTLEEIKAIPVAERDAAHKAVPSGEDLKASVTITIDPYIGALEKAYASAVEVTGVEKVGFSISSGLGHSTKAAAEGKGAKVQFETTFAVVALDKDGKIVKTLIDVAQNTVEFATDGKLVTDVTKEGASKKDLGAEYGMKKASAIGKEWDEQIKGLEDWTVGKTGDQVAGIAVEEGKTTDADLKATITVTITGYQKAVVEAVKAAK